MQKFVKIYLALGGRQDPHSQNADGYKKLKIFYSRQHFLKKNKFFFKKYFFVKNKFLTKKSSSKFHDFFCKQKKL